MTQLLLPAKGILFNEAGVRGINNTQPNTFPAIRIDPKRPTKSQTRRVVRLPKAFPPWTYDDVDWKATAAENGRAVILRANRRPPELRLECPYGGPGTILWIRESFGTPPVSMDIEEDAPRIPLDIEVIYKATRKRRPLGWRWLPGKFLPREHARLWIQVVEVRAEPLQNIPEEEAALEAAERSTRFLSFMESETEYFRRAWDGINAARGFPWILNPVVWVITFQRVVPPFANLLV